MFKKITLTNVKIGYKNFAGRASLFNIEGNRNFVVYLNDEQALMLRHLGCPVKTIKENKEKSIPKMCVVPVRVLYNDQVYNPDLRPRIYIKLRGGQEIFLAEQNMTIMDAFDVYEANLKLNVYRAKTANGEISRLYLTEGHFKVKKSINVNNLLRVMGIQ